MKKKIILVFLFTFFIFSAPVFEHVEASSLTVSTEFYDGYKHFAYDSFYELNYEENIIYSPVSLFYVLMMIYSFSSSDLELDFENYFGFTKEDMLLEIEHFTSDIQIDTEDGAFWFQNFIYYDNSPYLYNLSILEQNQIPFHYELGEYEFSNGDARGMLIEKIIEGTDHFIQPTEEDLMGLLSQSIVLNNTIYYQGIWEELFDESDNYEGDFHLSDGSNNTVTYMTKKAGSAEYYETDLAMAARIFMNDGASIAFILPNGENTILDVIDDTFFLSSLVIDTNNFYHREVQLTLPKFDISTRLNLNDAIEQLGLGKMYTSGIGSFEDLTDDPNFMISDIEQISRLMLDEEGVRIASSTFAVGCASSAPPLFFTLDQPFIFILYSTNEVPLFIGVIHQLGESSVSLE